MDIQLIIKAPNQNFEDHVVDCNLDWTIQKLKDHLSETYPDKPVVTEQKIIYSGRLLSNHLHLKDILRHEDGQSSVHILHLVCKANSCVSVKQKSYSSRNRSNQQTSHSRANNRSTGQSSENTPRNRNVTTESPPDQYSQFYQGYNSSPTMSAFIPDTQIAAQIAAMQQMYAYYFTQYIQSINPTPVPGTNPVFPDVANYQQPILPNDVPVQRQENQGNAQVGRALDDDDVVNRDWLDQLFLCCRFAVLFFVIYFYASPERLMLIIFCTVAAFLYHEGWFFRRANPVIPDAPQVPNNVPPDQYNENEPLLVNQDDSLNDELLGEHELENAMDGDDPPHIQNPDVANESHIFSPLTFLSTFFSSLIPERPAQVQIN